MFFQKNKNPDSMKIKKFYYYSPEKLKLIPIKNFIPKTIITLAVFGLTILVTSFISITYLMSDSNKIILGIQNKIIEESYEREIKNLTNKYKDLADQYGKLLETNNDLRISMNLEPLDINISDFGIGGSEFENLANLSSFTNGEKIKNIYEYINDIEVNIKFETSIYDEIANKFTENMELFNKLPAVRPVKASIGDRFGMRYHPILKYRRMHYGLDFLSNTGEEVITPGDGIVSFIGDKGGYGKVLKISHGFGYETVYAHLSKYKVKKGQKVKRGEVIALTGDTGSLSTGPHLHYEVRHNGVCLNPRNFIFENYKLFDEPKGNFLASN